MSGQTVDGWLASRPLSVLLGDHLRFGPRPSRSLHALIGGPQQRVPSLELYPSSCLPAAARRTYSLRLPLHGPLLRATASSLPLAPEPCTFIRPTPRYTCTPPTPRPTLRLLPLHQLAHTLLWSSAALFTPDVAFSPSLLLCADHPPHLSHTCSRLSTRCDRFLIGRPTSTTRPTLLIFAAKRICATDTSALSPITAPTT